MDTGLYVVFGVLLSCSQAIVSRACTTVRDTNGEYVEFSHKYRLINACANRLHKELLNERFTCYIHTHFFVSQGAGEAVDTPTKFTSPHYQRLLDDLWRMSTVARRNTPPFSDNGPEIAIGLSLIDIMSLDRDTGMTQMLTWDRYVSLRV